MVNFTRAFLMVPLALLSLLWLRQTLLRLRFDPLLANAIAIAFMIGTSFFHYGAAFFGHAMITWAALGAAYSLVRASDTDKTFNRLAWQAFAGFFAALAFAIEYQAFVICAALAAAILSSRKNWNISALLSPLIGAAGPIGLTLLYNRAAFGGFFETSYNHLYHAHSQKIHETGFFGISWPSIEGLYGLLLSPSRGVLLCAPIVALGLFGLPALWRRNSSLAYFVGVSVFGYLFVIAGSEIWYGGWGFGPRMLVPIFGLAAIAGAALCEELRASALASLGIAAYLSSGIIYNVFISVIFPELPHGIRNPLTTISVPLAKLGKPSPNLGMTLLNLEGLASLIPLALVVALLLVFIFRVFIGLHWRERAASVAFALVALLFALISFGYPESYSQRSADKLVESLASKRVDAK